MEEARGPAEVRSPAVVPTGDPAPAPGPGPCSRGQSASLLPSSVPLLSSRPSLHYTPNMLRSKHQVSAQSGESRSCTPWTPRSRDYCQGDRPLLPTRASCQGLSPFPAFSSATKALITRLLWSKGQFGSHVSTSAPEAQQCGRKRCRVAAPPECHPSPPVGLTSGTLV